MAPLISYSPSFPNLLLLLILLAAGSISTARGGFVGVNYGRLMDNPMPPPQVVRLIQDNCFPAAAIYDADAGVVQAFARSGIKLRVSLPNDELQRAGVDAGYADAWVRDHVAPFYPATEIDTVTVGNEVFHQRSDLNQYLLPAMRNVHTALENRGLAGAIKVSTPFAMSALADPAFPPSSGRFRDDLQPIVRQILEFLDGTGSFLMVNIYPYLAYSDPNSHISREYFLGLPNPGVRDGNTGLMYYNLLDAERDAFFAAVEGIRRQLYPTAASFVSLQKPKTNAGESGSPPKPNRVINRWRGQPIKPSSSSSRAAAAAADRTFNYSSIAVDQAGDAVETAQLYNSIMTQRIRYGRTGTPRHPDADMSVYIFSLFNENQKPESERTFGLFYPDGRKVYDLVAWCVADPAAGQQRMQAALDYACGQGGADCGPIRPGAPCFEANTVEAHASYAMNSYFQRHNRGPGTCDFAGVGQIVYRRPSFGNCVFPPSNWCAR